MKRSRRLISSTAAEREAAQVVNAAPLRAQRDAKPDVPGLIDNLTTARRCRSTTAPDTVELMRLVEGCNRLSAAKGAACALRLFAPHAVELYRSDPALCVRLQLVHGLPR